MSEYKTYLLGENDIDFWNEYVDRSANGTIYHRYEWLKIAEDHTGMRFLPVAVNKGNALVCLIPLFHQKKYGFRIVLSPPNACAIPHLGPVFIIPSTNRYNYEKTYIEIFDVVIRFVEQKLGFDYIRIIHNPDIVDLRPYIWKKFSIKPNYTYIFDLSKSSEEIFDNFHKTTKTAIRRAQKYSSIFLSNDQKYIIDILSMVNKRYKEQNRIFKITENYINQLLDSTLSGNIEATAIVHNGSIIAGSIDLVDKVNMYGWIGSVKREENISGAGEYLLWININEYQKRGYLTYDIVGANTKHLYNHKAKYGARLVQYFVVSKSSGKGKMALELMKLFGKANND